MRWQELPLSSERDKTLSVALKVPKRTMASIILKSKTFGTTKTLPRGGHPAKGKTGDEERDGHSGWSPEIPCGNGRNFQKTIINAAHQSGLDGRVVTQKPLLCEWQMKAHLDCAKKHIRLRETRFSGLKKPRYICLASVLSIMSRGKQATLITCTIPSHGEAWWWQFRDILTEIQFNSIRSYLYNAKFTTKVVSGHFQYRAGIDQTLWNEMKAWARALRTSDLAKGSPFNSAMTLNTQPRQCRNGLGITVWMSLSGHRI